MENPVTQNTASNNRIENNHANSNEEMITGYVKFMLPAVKKTLRWMKRASLLLMTLEVAQNEEMVIMT